MTVCTRLLLSFSIWSPWIVNAIHVAVNSQGQISSYTGDASFSPFGFRLKNKRSGHYLVGGRQADSCKIVDGSKEVGQCPLDDKTDVGFLWTHESDGRIKNKKTGSYLHAGSDHRSMQLLADDANDDGFKWEMQPDTRVKNMKWQTFLCADSWGENPRDTKVRILEFPGANDENIKTYSDYKPYGFVGFEWEEIPYFPEAFGFKNKRSGNYLVGGHQADSCKVVDGSPEVGQCPRADKNDLAFMWGFESDGRIKNLKTGSFLHAGSDHRSMQLLPNDANDDGFKWEMQNDLRIKNTKWQTFLCADSWGENPRDTKVRILEFPGANNANIKHYGDPYGFVGFEWVAEEI